MQCKKSVFNESELSEELFVTINLNGLHSVAAPGLGIWGGGHLRGNTHFGGGGEERISRNLPSPSLPKFLTPWIFFHTFFPKFFPRTFLIFFETIKNCPGLPKFFTDLPKIFPIPTKNVIFLGTFHKFLQFCLSNSDVSTTFGHFSQKSPLCRCGSYTHGSQRLMVSTEIIKNWGGGQNGGGQKIILGGHLPPPPLPPPWRRHCLHLSTRDLKLMVSLYAIRSIDF